MTTAIEFKTALESTLERVWAAAMRGGNGHRSSTKTNILHAEFMRYFMTMPEMSGTVIYVEDGSGVRPPQLSVPDMFDGTFNVDAAIYKNNELKAVILFKAPLTSLNKNRFNTINSAMGELNRIVGNPKNQHVDVFFVNLCPTLAPCKQPSSENMRIEHTAFLKLNEYRDRIGLPHFYHGQFHDITLPYDMTLFQNRTTINLPALRHAILFEKTQYCKIHDDAVQTLQNMTNRLIQLNQTDPNC